MAVSLKGKDAWRVNDQLPPGAYLLVIDKHETGKSSGGHPQIPLFWSVAAGDYKGAEQRDWITFTDPSLGGVVQFLEATGIGVPEQDFDSHTDLRDWVATQIKDGQTKAEAVIRMEPDRNDPDKEWPTIKGYRKPGDDYNDASGFTNGPSVKKDDVPFRAEPVPTFEALKSHEAREL